MLTVVYILGFLLLKLLEPGRGLVLDDNHCLQLLAAAHKHVDSVLVHTKSLLQ